MGVRVVDRNRSPGFTCANNFKNFQERAARDELERLTNDARLHLTERNRAFLRYIAEQTLAGNTKGAKAYSIAVDVFGRPPSFDPSLDPIVRIEAARLRAALDHYYDAYGSPNHIRVSLPRGHYVTEFSQVESRTIPGQVDSDPHAGDGATPASASAADRQHDSPSEMFAAVASSRAGILWKALAAASAVISMIMLALFFVAAMVPAAKVAKKPLVTLIVTTRDPANSARAADLEEELTLALSRFGTLRLATPQALSPSQRKLAAFGIKRRNTEDPGYQIALKYRVADASRRVTWTIIEPHTGETLASGEETADIVGENADAADAKLVAQLAMHFGSPLGLLNTMELHRSSAADEGNICVLRGEYALGRGTVADLARAHICLEAALKDTPLDADVDATLARVLVALDETSGTSSYSERALDLANQAVQVASHSDRALAARMVALYANGRNEAADDAGEEAVAANPLNNEIVGAFALRLYVTGSWAKGLSYAMQALSNSEALSTDASLVLALDAYRRHDPKAALKHLDVIVADNSIGSAIRVASLVQMARYADAVASLDEAEQAYPRFPRLIANILAQRGFEAELSRMLRGDIAAARAQI